MELVWILGMLGALGALGFLATRFGTDSRDAHRSREHELARFGMRWEQDQVPALWPIEHAIAGSQLAELRAEAARWRLVRRVQLPRQSALLAGLRRTLARGLLMLADRLSENPAGPVLNSPVASARDGR